MNQTLFIVGIWFGLSLSKPISVGFSGRLSAPMVQEKQGVFTRSLHGLDSVFQAQVANQPFEYRRCWAGKRPSFLDCLFYIFLRPQNRWAVTASEFSLAC